MLGAPPDHGLAGHAVPGAQVEDGAQAHGIQPPARRRHMPSTHCPGHTIAPTGVAELPGTFISPHRMQRTPHNLPLLQTTLVLCFVVQYA